MPKNTVFGGDILKLIFNATAIEDIAMNDNTSPATQMVIALHTADPGPTGNQTTSEISYTGYARVSVARTTGGWAVTNNTVSPVGNIDFASMSGGTGGLVTHFSVGTSPSATPNKILIRGTVTPNINVTIGQAPRLTTSSVFTEL